MLDTICVCAKLRRSARIATALYDEALAGSGFSVAQFSLLRMLQRAGPCSLTALGEATGHDRTTLNRTLKPLEAAGSVESAAGSDRRTRLVQVTPAARTAMARTQPLWEAAQARMKTALDGDQDHLFALLDRVEALQA
jgi:DNA-binding MarR family transcriptional regulator